MMRNPVAKYDNEFNKPKTFRDRKKDYTRKLRFKDEELHHPAHRPYEREYVNWTKEGMDADDYEIDGSVTEVGSDY